MNKTDGGPAFPIEGFYDAAKFKVIGGMTLRDYFAAAALSTHPAALLATAEGRAHYAYQLADAMLAERAK